jgi:hypothetical protein
MSAPASRIAFFGLAVLFGLIFLANHSRSHHPVNFADSPIIELRSGLTNSFKGSDGKVHQMKDTQIYQARSLEPGCRILPAGTRYFISLPTGKGGAQQLHQTTARAPFEICRASR